jgi:L-lactate dehydrogenase complex protein LldE
LLERLGCTVACPSGLTCCGQPALNAGCADDARAIARHTLEVLGRSPDPVVAPSGSCAEMIAHRYPELFHGTPQQAAAAELASRCYELTQFVTQVLGVARVPGRRAGRVTYHASCHLLRGLRASDGARRLLEGVLGAELVPLPGEQDCCGFGGLFAVDMSDISSAMLERKIRHILETGADTVVACDAGCLLQLEGGLRRHAASVKAVHLAELLVPDE